MMFAPTFCSVVKDRDLSRNSRTYAVHPSLPTQEGNQVVGLKG